MKNRLKSEFTIDFREGLEILISILSISLAITIVLAERLLGVELFSFDFFLFFLTAIFTVGIGFVLHELAHKAVAIGYGAAARFIMWPQGILLMFVTSIFGFIFAAPGAVYIFARNITKHQNGIISIAGVLTNIAISLIFFFFYLIAPKFGFFTINIWAFGAYINALLAAFNLIPFGPLDGRKVMQWNFVVWALSMVVSIGLFLFFLGLLGL